MFTHRPNIEPGGTHGQSTGTLLPLCAVTGGARITFRAANGGGFCQAGLTPLSETNYQVLDDLLQRAGAECDAAECHGALSGLACAGAPSGADQLLEQLLGDLDPAHAQVAECRDSMLRVLRACRSELASADMPFTPMLPDDDESISVRASALGRWCQGFLFGLSLGGLPDFAELPGDVGEIIHDLSEITRAGVDETGDEEQSEVAYAEIVEFIRVSVQLVHEELNPPVEPQDTAPTLH